MFSSAKLAGYNLHYRKMPQDIHSVNEKERVSFRVRGNDDVSWSGEHKVTEVDVW